MIKFKGEIGDRPLIGFGLSHENINRMLAGNPVIVRAKDFGIPFDVIIMVGDTEDSMRKQLELEFGPIPITHKTDEKI